MNNGAARVALVGHLCIVGVASLPGRHDGGRVRVTHCDNFGGRHAIVGEVIHDLPAAKGGNVAKLTVPFKRPQAQRGAQCIDGVKGIAVAINGPVAMSTLGGRCRGFRLGLLGRFRRGGLRGGRGRCRGGGWGSRRLRRRGQGGSGCRSRRCSGGACGRTCRTAGGRAFRSRCRTTLRYSGALPAGGERKTVPFRISSLNRRLAGLKKPVISISPNLQTSAPKKRKHKKGRGSPPRPSHRTKPALAAAPKRAVCFAHAGNITPAGPAQRPGLGRDAPQFRRGHLRRPRTHCPSGWPAQSSQSSPEGR